jgi:hypothetical protein
MAKKKVLTKKKVVQKQGGYKPADEVRHSISIKVSAKEKAVMQEAADKFFKGNISKWLRAAGLRYIPFKLDKIDDFY